MIIMKFGGSSLADAARILHVGEIVRARLHESPIVVLSAMGKTTDQLLVSGKKALTGIVDANDIFQSHIQAINDLGLSLNCVEELFADLTDLLKGITLLRDLSPRTLDSLMSFGERLSTRIFSAYLNDQGIKACHLDGWDAGIQTCSNHTKAEVLPHAFQLVRDSLNGKDSETLQVVAGFIGKDCHGRITTLGRGGSDLTAAIIGAALEVTEIQVWKDVHGILSSDPRFVASTVPVPSISFEEALELTYFGAKVLHPMSIYPAMKNGIPVRVKNSYDPVHQGTLITAKRNADDAIIKSIAFKQGQVLVHLCSTRMLGQSGFLAKVFQIFADLKISVDVIATSEVSISLTLENQIQIEELQVKLSEIATVNIQAGKAIISLIGNMLHSSEILEKSLRILSREGISVGMISHGASKVNISLVIDDGEVVRGVNLLHELFFDLHVEGDCSAI